jgi:hypothetical protein
MMYPPLLLNIDVVISCASVPNLDLNAGKVSWTTPISHAAGALAPLKMNEPSSAAITTPTSAAAVAATITKAEGNR